MATQDFQEGVSGPAVPDGELDSFQPTFNYGASITSAVASRFIFDTWFFRGLMKFDLSSLVGATITAAQLVLNMETVVSGNFASHVYRMTRDWAEGTGTGSATADGITWNTYDGTNTWTTAGGDYTVTDGVAFTGPSGTGALTITGLGTLAVDALTNRSNILNIILRADSEAAGGDKYYIWTSSEGVTASQHPKLTVTYTPAASTAVPLVLRRALLGVGRMLPFWLPLVRGVFAYLAGERRLTIRKDPGGRQTVTHHLPVLA